MAPRTTIADLPDDLLAHVLRFATGAARRDAQPAPPVDLSDWRYTRVSTAFRRAFLKNLASLALTDPQARLLALSDWRPLAPCTSLRRIEVGPDADLSDSLLLRLFRQLHARGVRLRQADLALDRHVTHATVLHFASLFGPHVTHFALRVPWNRRVRRRRGPDPPVIYHGAPVPLPFAADAAPFDAHVPPAAPLPADLFPPLHNNPAEGGFVPAPPPQPFLPNPHLHQHVNAQDGVQMIHIFDGVPALVGQAAFANLDEMMAAQVNEQQQPQVHLPDPNANVAEVHPVAPPMEAVVHHDHDHDNELEQEQNQIMEVVNDAVPNIFQALEANAQGHGNVFPPLPFTNNHNPHQYPSLDPSLARANSLSLALSDDVLATVLARMPMLRELRIERARHIMNPGILPLAHCLHLETLVLSGNHSINNIALKNVLSLMTRLRVLRFGEMAQVGNATISAVCTGPARKSLQVLELNKIGKVTDPAVRQLVNACENLQSVYIADCPRITCEAASHLSCALRLKDIYFKPPAEFPLTNRTSVHFSCAASTLRSLQLVGCKNLTLDGIVALGNLPGLRRLHLRGLGHVSQDVMRQLGIFSKLDDLVLEGSMHLTDLGVKVLIGQRGHRFLHLALLDSTRNLTDEALDCIMTWCVSLRSLEVHGQFKKGAIHRLQECVPNASLIVCSVLEGRQHLPGSGGVWDPIVDDAEVGDSYV